MGYHGGYGAGCATPATGAGSGFALIVVLFILLIIVGASFY
ncbi:YjcZ family sporulation protein [Paraliobacillus sediminis]|nr:YjcZ family sporulation protein [Paraliobacillus sediminis]